MTTDPAQDRGASPQAATGLSSLRDEAGKPSSPKASIPSAGRGNCPQCEVTLDGGYVWETFYRRLQLDGYYRGATPLNAEQAAIEADRISSYYGATRTDGRWGVAIALYDRDQDRTTGYLCPVCGHTWPASAMSAFGQDPKGLEAKPASAVAKPDAQGSPS